MKRPVPFAVLLLLLTVTTFAAEERVRCPVCGMFIDRYAAWHGTIEFSDKTRAVMDGPKDTFKYYLDVKKYNPAKSKADVAGVTVKDYYSKSDTDARKAFYVIWSDTYGPMGNEPIPFAREEDARKFLKEHKGKSILRFEEITSQVIWSLDHP